MIWKECVVAHFKVFSHGKTTNNLSQNGQEHCRDLNTVPPEYKSRALPLHQPSKIIKLISVWQSTERQISHYKESL
jgi:hypothetical protein